MTAVCPHAPMASSRTVLFQLTDAYQCGDNMSCQENENGGGINEQLSEITGLEWINQVSGEDDGDQMIGGDDDDEMISGDDDDEMISEDDDDDDDFEDDNPL